MPRDSTEMCVYNNQCFSRERLEQTILTNLHRGPNPCADLFGGENGLIVEQPLYPCKQPRDVPARVDKCSYESQSI